MPDCIACGESFDSLPEYERRRLYRHDSSSDRGTAFHGGAGRVKLESLLDVEECPTPPRLPTR